MTSDDQKSSIFRLFLKGRTDPDILGRPGYHNLYTYNLFQRYTLWCFFEVILRPRTAVSNIR